MEKVWNRVSDALHMEYEEILENYSFVLTLDHLKGEK